MSTSSVALSTPFLVFGAAVVGFAGWIAAEANRHAPASQRSETESVTMAPIDLDAEHLELHLNVIKPGVPRLTVEQELTRFPGTEVEPVHMSEGRPVFRSHYSLQLTRPIPKLMPTAQCDFTPGSYVLTLEFDGGTAGHPVTHVELTPASAH